MMDVPTVGGEDRLATQESTGHGDQRVEHGQPERHDGNRHRHHGRRLLRAQRPDPGKHKPDEQAAGIAEEDRGRVEIEIEEPQHRARQCQRHQPGAIAAIRDRHHEHRGEREHRRTGRQSIETVDQIERVGDAHEPQHGEQQAGDGAQIDDPHEGER